MLQIPKIPRNLSAALFVYVDLRPCGAPFYVGIGNADRVRLATRYRNRHHTDIVAKYPGCLRQILCVVPDREYANRIECALIARWGRVCDGSGILCNQSSGGDGYVDPSPAVREARRRAMTGKRWKNKPGANAAAVAASRAANAGNTHTIGMIHTDEARAKMSMASKGKAKPELMRARLALARRLRHARVLQWIADTGTQISSKFVTNAMMAGGVF